MKLNTKQTIKIGFAFLAICAFWQMYNSVVPLMLTETFSLNEMYSGIIMAADNVLALFLLPLFGGISDRCKSKIGKRKPFIFCGTLASVFLMLMVPWMDNQFFASPSQTKQVIFICVLGCLLVAMGTYRSPAVALMPDVTPKPLRSKANAIINLMGAVGGIMYLLIASVMYSQKRTEGLKHVDYMPLFLVVAGIMIVALIIIMLAVDEVQLNSEMKRLEAEYERAAEVAEESVTAPAPEGETTEKAAAEKAISNVSKSEEKLPTEVKKSLIFLLFSISLWFIGYNAVETWFTTYANEMWNMSLGGASMCLTVATGGAILSYIPVGQIASKIGRKKTIKGGVILLGSCFFVAFLYTLFSHKFHPALYGLFLLVGLAWAAINVNSLPMVLEMCKGSDVGKFTGYYYAFSMAAQIITPILAGFLLHKIGYATLFPYAAVFVAGSFATMCMVKHGDSKVEAKKGLDAFDVDD